jgi:DNA polymerase-3 subunit gamma/tau
VRACLDIDAGRFVDLLEIDAASNTGVDDVRALIENAQYMPARGRTKVYLIDEVHMLSKSAFNALLKTLEEPPGHVKFLLATTDPQKLPVTVLSRCLQFNLRRLEPGQIEQQMARILGAEGIAFDPGALQLLARAADGSLRDGLSLLDQAIAHTGSAGGGRLDEAGDQRHARHRRARARGRAAGHARGRRRRRPDARSRRTGAVLARLRPAARGPGHRTASRAACTSWCRASATRATASTPPRSPRAWRRRWCSCGSRWRSNGRRDLGLAPSARAGLEMTLLRMLAFRPAASGDTDVATRAAAAPARQADFGLSRTGLAPPATPAASSARPTPMPAPATFAPAPEAATAPPPAPAPVAELAPMPMQAPTTGSRWSRPRA